MPGHIPQQGIGRADQAHGHQSQAHLPSGQSAISKAEVNMSASSIEALASGVPPKDVAKNLGVSIPKLYRLVPVSAQA